jgi:septal ring factor EnvC (AmiA/AmiB activator)
MALTLAPPLAIGFPRQAAAQNGTQRASSPADLLKQRDKELEAVRAEQKKAAETEKKLRSEIDRLGEDRRKLNQTMIDTAANIRTVEQELATIDNRLQLLENSERGINNSLESRREVIAQVLAALQRIGSHPPPALLVRPEDALKSVRTAILLGAVIPELRSEADLLVADLADLVRVRREAAAERTKRTADLANLNEQRTRLSLLIDQRKRRLGEVEGQFEAARRRAMQLALQADNLKDLIARLESSLDAATRAARNNNDAHQSATQTNLAALKDPGRLTPAIAFAAAKGLLPLPVNGTLTREFGTRDRLGGIEKGVSIATRPTAQVTSPCDGWVVYAAPYRSYGQLLILNAGGGYHVLLAGMERISVELGHFVLTGEPVGVMGNGSTSLFGFGASTSPPVLYIEFRKDGLPVDPSPWWATNDSEKVRG